MKQRNAIQRWLDQAKHNHPGRGSGVYDVYRMLRRGQSVGAYIEFLRSGDEPNALAE